MRLVRPLTIAAALALTVPLGGAAGAATATPAQGDATSTATLLSVTAGGSTLEAVTATLSSTTIGASKAALELVPVTKDGTKIGAISIDQDTASQPSVGAQTASLPGLASLTSPSLTAKASRTSSGPSATLAGSALGSVSLLGLPLPALTGSVDVGASVLHGTSAGTKSLHVDGFALPGVGDLLGALGLDLTALPTSTLTDLLDQLGLTTSAVSTAQSALDAAQTAAGTAFDSLDAAQAAVTAQQSAVTTAQSTLTSATSTLTGLVAAVDFTQPTLTTILTTAGVAAPTDAASWDALDPTVQFDLVAALDLLSSGSGTAIATAETAYAAAQTAFDAANTLLSTLQNILDLLTTLTDTVTAVLDSTPLVSVGAIDVGTLAKAGGTHAASITGTISGLHVLGTDVLDAVFGSSSVDLASLTGQLTAVQGVIDGLTGTLSDVLSSVTGLDVPMPEVSLLQKSTSTAPSGAFQAASATVDVLGIRIPAITLPDALALPTADGLAVLTAVTGGFTSAPLELHLGTFTDAARYQAATSVTTPSTTPSTTPTGGGSLATTGAPAGLAAAALLLVGAGALVRRFRRPAGEPAE